MAHALALRPAAPDDLAFLSALALHPSVEPYLAPGRGQPGALRDLLSPPLRAPEGLYAIEAPAGRLVGGLAVAVVNHRSRICEISRVMLHGDVRGAGIASDAVRLAARTAFASHGMHRVEAQVYGTNEAGQRLFDRAGFTREGMRRRAYWRGGEWVDGVLYGLLAGELTQGEATVSASTGSPP